MTLEHLDIVIAFVVVITGVSLLVTVLTQLISAFLGLRGTNLRWGIETLLRELDPNLQAHAAAISRQVLQHPLISDSTFAGVRSGLVGRWKLASAIRQDELVGILHLLAQPAGGTVASPREPWRTALATALENLDAGKVDDLVLAAPEIHRLFPDDPEKAARLLAQLTTAAEQMPGDIHRWFGSVMDRVSQRFAVHTRVWTVIFSILLAFALHLDGFKLLTQLSTDGELRSRLVASADALSKKADDLLTTAGTSGYAFVEAMKQLIAGSPELRDLDEPAGFKDLAGGKAWLAAQLAKARVPDPDRWQRQYEELVPQSALRTAATDLRSILNDKLKFQVIPDPYPVPFYNYWTPSWLHFWGIVASAALLSLGAPFWYNALAGLCSLRPALANKQAPSKTKDAG